MLILNEEPVAYDAIRDYNQDVWVYRNPTKDEVEEVFKIHNSVRCLFLDNDYYIATSYYLVHSDMVRLLLYLNKTSVYDAYTFIDGKTNELQNASCFQNTFYFIKPFLSDMIEVGLIDMDTEIKYFREDEINNKTVKGLIGNT